MTGFRTTLGDLTNLQAFLTAIGADTIGIRLVDDTYTDLDTDIFLDATDTAALADQPMTGASLDLFQWTADTPVIFPAVTDLMIVRYVVYYIDSGLSSTSRIIGVEDRRADTSLIALNTNGNDVTMHFPAGRVGSL